MEQAKWVNGNIEVKKWIQELERRSEATAKSRCYHLFHYFVWLKDNKNITSARQLLDHYRQLKKQGNEYEHNDWAKEYLLTEKNKKKSFSWREGGLSSIRGFYRFNRCPLPDERMDLHVREVDAQRLREKASLKTMTLEDFKKLVGPAKIREKSELLTMLQSGMGIGELVHQFNVCTCDPEYVKNHGHICVPANVLRQLREGKCPIKVYPLIAFKRSGNDDRKTYFTFIGKDAINCLKEYLVFRKQLVTEKTKEYKILKEREKAGYKLNEKDTRKLRNLENRLQHVTPELKDGEPIYITNYLNPIREHSLQIAVPVLKKQSGLLDRKFTPHTCRDLFKTECSHAGVDDKISEFWIRHALDKYGYNQLDKMHPEDFEAEYAKVEPVLNVLSGPGEAHLKKIGELENKIDKKSGAIETLVENNVNLQQKLGKLEDRLKELEDKYEMKTRVLVEALETFEPYKEIVQRVEVLPENQREIVEKTIRQVADRILNEFLAKAGTS